MFNQKSENFPKPKLIVANDTKFLNKLKECPGSLFCIATKPQTLEALNHITSRNDVETWAYNLIKANSLIKELGSLLGEKPDEFVITNEQKAGFSQLRDKKIMSFLDATALENNKATSLSSLFFNLVLRELKQSKNTNTVYVFVDELTNIGSIPNLALDISTIRAFNIGLVLATCALDKLEMIYGTNNSAVILSNAFDGRLFSEQAVFN